MSHIVDSCPLTKLAGGLSKLHSVDDDAVAWLTNCDGPQRIHTTTTTVTSYSKFIAESEGVKILKIDRHIATL